MEVALAEWSVVIAVALSVCVWILQCRSTSDGRRIQTWPIVGCYFEISAHRTRFHDWLFSKLEKSPTATISSNLFEKRFVWTANPLNVEYILKTNFANFPKGKQVCERAETMLGRGIFASDGDLWKTHRKVSSFEFTSKKLRHFSIEIFREGAIRLIDILHAAAKAGKVVDFQDLVLRMTLDSIFKFACGADLGCLSPSLPNVEFGRSFDNANEITEGRVIGVTWKLKRFLNIGSEKQLQKDMKVLHRLVQGIIDARKAEMAAIAAADKKSERDDLLSRFIQHESEDGKVYNDEGLRDVILNFTIAGRDTTASTLAWFMYRVCCHAEVAKRIREEMRDLIGFTPDESHTEFAAKLSFNELSSLNYLHAALTETIRLHPPVPKDSKSCAESCVLPDGTHVRKNSQVIYVPYSMGRLTSIWGSDALEFKPERWLVHGQFVSQSPFKFSAFQAGPRVCLGKESAYLQLKMVVAVVLRFLTFTRPDPQDPVTYRLGLVQHVLHGLPVLPALLHPH